MTIDPATNPVAGDAARVRPATEVATGPRAMLIASTSIHPMLRGPMVAYAPDQDGGGEAAVEPEAGPEAGDDAATGAETDPADAGEDDAEGGDEGEAGDTADNPAEDDAEEVEHDGAKYKVPKALKDAFLRHADYTQKTQALAEERKAHEAERTTWQAQQVEQLEALRGEYGRVEVARTQIAPFKEVNWAEAYRQAAASDDPAGNAAAVDKAHAQFKAIEAELTEAEKSLNEKIEARSQSQREASAKAMQEVGKVLGQQIEGFSKEVAGELIEIAKSRGMTDEDMYQADDPRAWLLLNDLRVAKAENARLKAQLDQKAKIDRHEQAQGARPAASVSGRSSPPAGLDDRQNTKAWMAQREAQVAKRAGR